MKSELVCFPFGEIASSITPPFRPLSMRSDTHCSQITIDVFLLMNGLSARREEGFLR